MRITKFWSWVFIECACVNRKMEQFSHAPPNCYRSKRLLFSPVVAFIVVSEMVLKTSQWHHVNLCGFKIHCQNEFSNVRIYLGAQQPYSTLIRGSNCIGTRICRETFKYVMTEIKKENVYMYMSHFFQCC